MGAGTAPAPTIELELDLGRRYYKRVKVTDLSAEVGAAVSASRQVLDGDVCELLGWRIVETTGAAAMAFRLHDGSGSAGTLLTVGGAASAGVDSMPISEHGIEVQTGKVYLEVKSGSMAGVLYWR